MGTPAWGTGVGAAPGFGAAERGKTLLENLVVMSIGQKQSWKSGNVSPLAQRQRKYRNALKLSING